MNYKYLENNNIKDFVIDILVDKLDNLKGEEYKSYSCDLAYNLFEGENIDGVYFYNNYEATEFIKKHFEDLGEIIEELNFQFGKEYVNKLVIDIFDNPDRFCVVVFMEVASYLLSQCKIIDELWNEEIILTNDKIDKIKKELENQKNCIPLF